MTMNNEAERESYPSLYDRTGDIKDINTLLVPRAALPSQPQGAWNALTDEDRQRAMESMPDMLEGFCKTWGWLHFAKAIEAICREKNLAHPQPTERSAELEAVQSDAWISVDERLPARWEDVLVHPRPTDYCCEAHYTGNGWEYGEYEHHFGHVNTKCTVTHWMPLPHAPIAAAPQKGEAA